MTARSAVPHSWQRSIQKVVAVQPITRFFARFVHHLDRFALRLTGGRFSPTSALTGLPVATLTMTGAKTGIKRELPVVFITNGEIRVLIASNLGSRANPGWYYNLCENPHISLSENNKQGKYTARQASPAEREKYWKEAVHLYPGYEDYRERAGDRLIPIMVLEPAPGD